MVEKIIKRDGRQVLFDLDKIADAINKAFMASTQRDDPEYSLKLAHDVVHELEEIGFDNPSVEQIQDCVERVLVKNGHVRTAKAYMVYRSERTRVRQMKTNLMKIYEDITFKDAKDSDLQRENANVNADTAMGTMLKYGSEGAKQFYEMFVLKPEFAEAHKNGDIHIHDLDFLTMTTTCTQIDLLKLFNGGFSTGHGVLREPNDIASYSALACIAIQSNQNDQHGGQSIINFDYGMAPGIVKTYQRKYTQNLQKAIQLTIGVDIEEATLKAIRKELLAEGNILRIADSEGYRKAELPKLVELGVEKDAAKKAHEVRCRKLNKGNRPRDLSGDGGVYT